MYDDYGLFIGGEWRGATGGATYPVLNPATEDTLGEAPAAQEADVHAAIAAAGRGMAAWRKKHAWERAAVIRRIGEILESRIDDIARIMTLEIGKPLAQSKGELQLCVDQFLWYAEETKRIYGQIVESRLPGARLYVTHEPVGIVAAFSAWNFPAVLASRKIAPALAAGCAVIVRPSVEGPGTVMALVKCCEDAGVPAGAVNLLTGRSSVISPIIMASPEVRKITLTGSTAVGQLLIRQSADTVKRVSMELGGHAPVIVFDDADILKIAEASATAKFRNCGQVCVSPTRFFVHESKLDQFTDAFVQHTKALKIGNGLEDGVDVGPLATKKRLDEVEAMVADTVAEGASVLTGGRRAPGFNRGYFYEPTVFGGVKDSARIMNEEPFGPLVPITGFRDYDEVIGRANALELGLASYIFTRSLERAHKASADIEAGLVAVNTFAIATAEAPFGGIKQSGYGREGGSIGIKDYLNVKYTNMVFAE